MTKGDATRRDRARHAFPDAFPALRAVAALGAVLMGGCVPPAHLAPCEEQECIAACESYPCTPSTVTTIPDAATDAHLALANGALFVCVEQDAISVHRAPAEGGPLVPFSKASGDCRLIAADPLSGRVFAVLVDDPRGDAPMSLWTGTFDGGNERLLHRALRLDGLAVGPSSVLVAGAIDATRSLYRIEKDGSHLNPVPMTDTSVLVPAAVVRSSSGRLYYSYPDISKIVAIDESGAHLDVLFEGRPPKGTPLGPYELAVGESELYFAFQGALYHVDSRGSGPAVVVTGAEHGVRSPVVIGDRVVWLDHDAGAIRSFSATDRTVRVLAESLQDPRSLVADARYLYWAEMVPRRIVRLPIPR